VPGRGHQHIHAKNEHEKAERRGQHSHHREERQLADRVARPTDLLDQHGGQNSRAAALNLRRLLNLGPVAKAGTWTLRAA
jgi:hypothetical protein